MMVFAAEFPHLRPLEGKFLHLVRKPSLKGKLTSLFSTRLILSVLAASLHYSLAQGPQLSMRDGEKRMKVARLLGLLVVGMILVPFAYADGPVQMVFQGVNGANDGQYYVSPYYGTMNGQTVTLFCDDIVNDVTFWQTWDANVTNLATAVNTNNFSQTRYGGVTTSAVYGNPAKAYEEAAWLTTQFASNPGDLVNLQYALWDIMNPLSRGNSNLDVQNWLMLASENYGTINLSNFEIVTNCGPLTLTGQVQEFIVQTPEPGTLALLICGMLAVCAWLMRRGQLTA